MSTRSDLMQVLARLELVSHGTTQSFDPQPVTTEGDDQGGHKPRGGATDDRARRWEDGAPADMVMLRSADHFRRRLAGCVTEGDLQRVLRDALVALESYRRAPVPGRDEQPPWDDVSRWKRWAWHSKLHGAELARRSGVSRQAVYKRMRGYNLDNNERKTA